MGCRRNPAVELRASSQIAIGRRVACHHPLSACKRALDVQTTQNAGLILCLTKGVSCINQVFSFMSPTPHRGSLGYAALPG